MKNTIFGIKNEEHHENVTKIPLDFGYTSKKRRTPFYWVSKLRRAIRKWLQPLNLEYISKKEEHHFLGLKIKKSNKKMAKTIGFWVYLQKKEPLCLCNRMQKNDKILENWKPLG
jgi:hypothetical protein